jgi:hypothetical protein
LGFFVCASAVVVQKSRTPAAKAQTMGNSRFISFSSMFGDY